MRCTDQADSPSGRCLQIFLDQTQLRMSSESQRLCVYALNAMSESCDTLHARDHICRMLQDLVLWLKADPNLNTEIRQSFEVIVLAICCHDLWKSQRTPQTGLAHYLWGCVWDGPGSAQIFQTLAREFGIAPHIAREAAYSIRVHSGTQIRPRKTLAAKVLNDLDVLDYLSAERMQAVKAFIHRQPRWRQALIAKILVPVDLACGPNSLKRRYFTWTDMCYRQRSLSAFGKIGLLPPSKRPVSVQANYQTF